MSDPKIEILNAKGWIDKLEEVVKVMAAEATIFGWSLKEVVLTRQNGVWVIADILNVSQESIENEEDASSGNPQVFVQRTQNGVRRIPRNTSLYIRNPNGSILASVAKDGLEYIRLKTRRSHWMFRSVPLFHRKMDKELASIEMRIAECLLFDSICYSDPDDTYGERMKLQLNLLKDHAAMMTEQGRKEYERILAVIWHLNGWIGPPKVTKHIPEENVPHTVIYGDGNVVNTTSGERNTVNINAVGGNAVDANQKNVVPSTSQELPLLFRWIIGLATLIGTVAAILAILD